MHATDNGGFIFNVIEACRRPFRLDVRRFRKREPKAQQKHDGAVVHRVLLPYHTPSYHQQGPEHHAFFSRQLRSCRAGISQNPEKMAGCYLDKGATAAWQRDRSVE